MDEQKVARELMDAARTGQHWFPHDTWTQLRAEPTIVWLEPEDFDPFWAIVKHADVREISTQPDKFSSETRAMIMPRGRDRLRSVLPVRLLLDMDPPDHRVFRKFVNVWFTPRNIRKLEERMRESARDLCDMMASHGTWEGDFVQEVAAIHPVRMISYLFGMPASEEPRLIYLANSVFGTDDPEFIQNEEHLIKFLAEMMEYFAILDQARKANPGEDLASAIATAEIDGEPLGVVDALGYYSIILTAGHETTRTAMSGGLYALMQNRQELHKLKAHPELVASAMEEMVRWVSPVNMFGRTATEDYRLRGQVIEKGESVVMFYGSANRDEEVFDMPFEFRVDRNPNPHFGFGVGEHFCLGASLARLEMRVFFEEFIARLDIDSLELTGDVQYLASTFVGGVKHLPMRCRVQADPAMSAGAA